MTNSSRVPYVSILSFLLLSILLVLRSRSPTIAEMPEPYSLAADAQSSRSDHANLDAPVAELRLDATPIENAFDLLRERRNAIW